MSEYVRKYSNFLTGQPLAKSHLLSEMVELVVEVGRGNLQGVKEEAGDVCHTFQIVIYLWLGIDTKLWWWCAKKFVRRIEVWQKLYTFCGVQEAAKHGGNYMKLSKVVAQMARFGVSSEKAEEAYNKIIKG